MSSFRRKIEARAIQLVPPMRCGKVAITNCLEGTAVQEPENIQDCEAQVPSADAPVKDWHKPVLTIAPASNAENLPGGFPDAGIDFS
ncbi:hypothetical protein WHZ77_03090 [Bradyrhizobium sp. A5]|uniref:hypothetical protein n=1 Tax=Bradyrhizobium sp. A5 TaxID=3133696 RepID=UPI0032549EED